MATRFTPKTAAELKRGDVLYPSGARITDTDPCDFHLGSVWLTYRERGRRFDDCFAPNLPFVVQERV